MSDLLTRSVAKLIPKSLAEEKIKSKKKLRVYWGIDPTGSHIHLGHTIPIRKLQAFANEGHEAILLIGSFTAMLGDPSDKEAMRKPLSAKQVQDNFLSYKEQASKVLDFTKIKIVYNHEWLSTLKYEDIMHHASLFTVQQMEQRDAFEKRMKAGNPLGVHEFLYPMMVGYDSVHLDVDCEIGGTDQEFNMLAGRTMQKAMDKREKFIITLPLLEGLDGRLMSKSYHNCVYLDDEPSDMYGKLMSLNDDLITKYMQHCTDIPIPEIKAAAKAMETGGNPKEYKMRLAHEVVKMYHDASTADKAQKEFEAVFKEGGIPDDIAEVKMKKGTMLIDLLVDQKLIASKSDGRRLIEQGGVKKEDVVIGTVEAEVEVGVYKVGKRKFLRVV